MILFGACAAAVIGALIFEMGMWAIERFIVIEVPRGELAEMYWMTLFVLGVFAGGCRADPLTAIGFFLPSCFIVGCHCYLTDKYWMRLRSTRTSGQQKGLRHRAGHTPVHRRLPAKGGCPPKH